MPQQKAVIIGAGIAGIAAAIRLAVKGYTVEVYEANSYPGGKLSQFEQNGYRFDAGPSLFTMPQYVDELFKLAGKNAADYFGYQKLDVVCKYFYEDGTRLSAYADTKQFAKEIEDKTQEPAAAIIRHLANSRDIYDITNHVFLERSLHRLKTFLRWDTIRSILRFPQIDPFRTMHKANLSGFKDARIVQFFDRYSTYNGSDPYQAPATLNVIPHLEHHFGAYFPDGGMYSITQSLVKLAEELGVQFKYNYKVDEIVVINSVAKGIRAKGEDILADVVVSNMDVWFTYNRLLSKHPKLHPKKILSQERSSSALIFYWGINKQFPELDLHNIFFSADYQTEFDHIWNQQDIYHDPTVYLNISSKYKTDDAPEGCENWFVMINVPANNGQDWDQLIATARNHIMNKLSRLLHQDIGKLITTESILDPRGIENKTSSYKGSIYGTSSNSQFAAFLRHANRSSKAAGLYFCGGSVHPGGGIPLCLLSAKITAGFVK
ncbi:1-hydroxycarotenoid 3,4-desaturase CrtD [Mucilaginibacter phyllosphaerae]|uniref:Phytoene desaturase n=1 Tax=Mucilaginibacter phyllosphaerae TaxID=1812349 RepID=A0A4Y8A938_9SPHI|nr:1-hydroxycarotenoid 3,4-desaturase CrtD [Mucilaginibacter phyllosphaerae]MBB3969566.1 phytoene desaturase [Mucilaginibacter phyllosphaerae]TEW64958.1 phytoene desaturase [Mucilaginibacter phyllosphaerae]GGH18863.1 phytoene desaturase [Mucilaginibacter phyllosphaerae]